MVIVIYKYIVIEKNKRQKKEKTTWQSDTYYLT